MLLVAVAACGGASPRHAAGAPAAQSAQQRAHVVWLRYATCARAHGVPDFPDPRLDSQGRASFPSDAPVKQESAQVNTACGAILKGLPASATRNGPVTAAQLRLLIAWARCMRSHGVPNWPDPRSDGTFPIIGTPLAAEGKTGPVLGGMLACRHIYSGSISAS
jgi:hypothetical protein